MDFRLTNSARKMLGTLVLLTLPTTALAALPVFKPGDPLTASNLNALADAISNSSGSTGTGESAQSPAASCSDLHTQRPSLTNGIYWVQPASSNIAFRVYCDMVTDGGGWTLVWNNLRGGRSKVVTELQYNAAVHTPPRYRGEPSSDIESFEVFVGLKHWIGLAGDTTMELRYDWSVDYQQTVSQRYTCSASLDSASQYRISFVGSTCQQPIGAVPPGLVTVHNGSMFSAYNNDNDNHATESCSVVYGKSPWWYNSCVNGSLMGGGEDNVSASTNTLNGAYWIGNLAQWATISSNAEGAGNGWIFIRTIR